MSARTTQASKAKSDKLSTDNLIVLVQVVWECSPQNGVYWTLSVLSMKGISANSQRDQPRKQFVCELCRFTAPYDYFGKRPPFKTQIV